MVFEGGFGVKTLGKPDPVDADTLFLAASNTKAMTTLLLAELVDEQQAALGPAGHRGLSGLQARRRRRPRARCW